jgi:hypothetical protein
MPGTTVGTSMNPGYAGQRSRNNSADSIEAKLVKTTDTANINFGDAVVLNNDATGGTFSQAIGFIAGSGTFLMQVATGIKNSVFAGFAMRQVKAYLTYTVNYGAPGAGPLNYYSPGQIAEVMTQGYIMVPNYKVFSSNAAPTAGGAVFFRTATNGAGTAVGDLNTQADGSNTVQLTNCQWATGEVDTVNNTIEVCLVSRNIP